MAIEFGNNYREWVKKAEEDLISLESLLKHKDGSPSTGCFLAQQAAEKLLKALLIYKEFELEKVHDLVKIINTLELRIPEVRGFENDITTITRYYIETRYPGDYPEFTWNECQKAHEIILKIKVFVLSKMIEDVKGSSKIRT
jgi:HEPN domain-containing protein